MKLTLIFFGIEILCFLLIFFGVLINEKKQHFSHEKNVENLEKIILNNHKKQNELNSKVLISRDYQTYFQKNMKAIAEEIVELQYIFMQIISNRKK